MVTLSERELEVVELLRRGLDRDAIAGRLEISIHTVESHVQRIAIKVVPDLPLGERSLSPQRRILAWCAKLARPRR